MRPSASFRDRDAARKPKQLPTHGLAKASSTLKQGLAVAAKLIVQTMVIIMT